MTVKIKTFTGGPLQNNTYLITNDVEGVLIDPSHVTSNLLQGIKSLKELLIFLTHAHFDHIQGINEILKVASPRIWIHQLEEKWLTDPKLNLSIWANPSEPIIVKAKPYATWNEDQSIELLGEQAEVLHTPGHSPGHTVLKWGTTLFSGDALFYGSIGRTDLPGGDQAELIRSITTKILTLPENTRVLPGHGPETTVKYERLYNPYI